MTSLSPVDEAGHETRVAVEVHRDSANGGVCEAGRYRRPSVSIDVIRWNPVQDRCLRRWHTDGQDDSPPHDAADLEVAAIFVRPRDVVSSFDESETEDRSGTRRSQDKSPRGDTRVSPLVHVDRLWALREAYEEQDRQKKAARTDTTFPADRLQHATEGPRASAAMTAPTWRQSREFAFSFDSGDTCETDEGSRQGAPTTSFESSTDGGTDASGRGPKLQQIRDDSGYKSLETVPASHQSRDDATATRAAKSHSLDGRNGKTASRRRRDYRRDRHAACLENRGTHTDSTAPVTTNSRRMSRDYSIDEHTDAIFNEFMRYDPALPDFARMSLKHVTVVDRGGRCRIAHSSRSMSIGCSGEPATATSQDRMYTHMRRLSKQKTCSARDRKSSQDRSFTHDKADTHDKRHSKMRTYSQDATCQYTTLSQVRTASPDRRLAHNKAWSQVTHCADRRMVHGTDSRNPASQTMQ